MMKDNSLQKQILFAIGLVTLLVVSRLTSHLWNMTAVGGVALFAGAYISKKQISILILLIGMLISDSILGFHNQIVAVYLAYVAVAVLGFLLSPSSPRSKIILFSFFSAILFFLITNFAVWYGGFMYPQTAEGLMQSYMMGLPFFRNQLIGDLISSIVLFELVKLPSPAWAVRLKL